MRIKFIIFIFNLVVCETLFGLAADDHQTIRVSVVTSKPEEGLARVLRAGTKLGGYFQEATALRAHIRLPKDRALKLSKQLSKLGDIKSYEITGDNYTPTQRSLETKLLSKEKMLKSYIDLIRKAKKPEEIIQAENAAAQIITEIEQFKSQLNEIADKMQYSELIVNFGEPDTKKQQITKNVESNFEWMNKSGLVYTLNQDLIEEEEYEEEEGDLEDIIAH